MFRVRVVNLSRRIKLIVEDLKVEGGGCAGLDLLLTLRSDQVTLRSRPSELGEGAGRAGQCSAVVGG